MARHNDVRLKASYDQSLSDSDNIEDFTPSAGGTFPLAGVGSVYFAVRSNPDYSYGIPVYDASVGTAYIGFATARYTQPMCHIDSFAWLKSNYEGQVTAYIRTTGTTYARYNCQLRFEFTNLTTRPNWGEVVWVFKIIEAL